MPNHNLFIHGADGAVQPATTEQILAAARAALAHRVRRGASLDSPQKVREYLTVRLGHLDHEIFGVILLDQRHRVIEYVELFRGTIDGAGVYPREVVKLALEKGAAACVLLHNHPSGVKGSVPCRRTHHPPATRSPAARGHPGPRPPDRRRRHRAQLLREGPPVRSRSARARDGPPCKFANR